MSNSIRIRTTPGGEDKYIKFKLEQDFDILEILSLKLTQQDIYRRFYSDYGVVVGRVIMNNGVGVPNSRVSIFVPIDKNENEEIKTLYPYDSVVSKNDDGVRYNLLPKERKNKCHVPVGTFPSKREILDNEESLEIFEKYYKYTATTNDAGDFMIFGVPVGNHTINIDVDISDMGIFSQKPYDLIEQGTSEKLFSSTTQFKKSKNLNTLPQVKNQKTGINVIPFWGDKQSNEVGITRVDFDLNYELKPKAIFIGSAFGDNGDNSINKNCGGKKDTGRLSETTPYSGRFSMIRKRMDGEIEQFFVEGGDLIDNHGTWAYQIPMNLDYMVTDEFGKLIPTEEPNKGIPTRTQVRFKLESDMTGGEGRLRTKADYLIPHNPKNKEEIDYEFGEKTKSSSFRDMYWNKIYTVKNFIPRFQSNGRLQSRRFIGLKDIDDAVGAKNPAPFNRLDTDFNPLYSIICVVISVIIGIIGIVNGIISLEIDLKIVKIRPFCKLLKCIQIECGQQQYRPNCHKSGGSCYKNTNGDTTSGNLLNCYQSLLAEAFNVYELDFYNDWLNGSVYNPLLKYKKKKDKVKFCDVDKYKTNFIHDTLIGDKYHGHSTEEVNQGFVKNYKDNLYYAPSTNDGSYKLFATDIVSLGVVNDYDWQGQPSLQPLLDVSTYKLPPFLGEEDGFNYTPVADYKEGSNRKDGLLFNLSCKDISVSVPQVKNIKRLCELGVGIDEDRSDEPGGFGKDGNITDGDIDSQYARDIFILLNSPNVKTLPETGLSSGFKGNDYKDFVNLNSNKVPQTDNSFYFYFGTEPNKTALDKLNKKYFQPCVVSKKLDYGEE
jgi:hypothetical protein